MQELNDFLQHTGIKGMRWGVRRNRNRPGGADGVVEVNKKVDKPKGKLSQKLDSMKREREWVKVLRDLDNISTKELKKITTRVKLENSMKALSKSPVAKQKDKQDYLNRHKMDDLELARKVARLQAKNGLYTEIRNASKEQREFGEKVVNVASNLAFKYVKTKYVDKGQMTLKDTVDILAKPKTLKKYIKDEGKNEFNKQVEKRSKQPNPTP